jgi:hypothetical protein
LDSIENALHRGTFDTEDFDPIVAAWGNADELAEGASFGAPQSIPLRVGNFGQHPFVPPPAAPAAPLAASSAVQVVKMPRSHGFFDRLAVGDRDAVIVAVLATVALGGLGIWGWMTFGKAGVLGKALGAAALAG